jgi:hypothetical protein
MPFITVFCSKFKKIDVVIKIIKMTNAYLPQNNKLNLITENRFFNNFKTTIVDSDN